MSALAWERMSTSTNLGRQPGLPSAMPYPRAASYLISAMIEPMRPNELDPSLTIKTLAVHAGQEPDELTTVRAAIYRPRHCPPAVGQPIND